MEKNYLLPYRYKKIGLYMFIPFCAFFMYLVCTDSFYSIGFEMPLFAVVADFPAEIVDTKFFGIVHNSPFDEIALLGMLASLAFIALSKEKDEDEMTGYIRMQSFVWSLWATTAFCAFGILFIFGLSYLYFTYLAVFLMPIVYIAKFNMTMRKIRKQDNEK